MPLYSSFFGRWSDRIAIPMLEIGINVAEKISSPRKRFLTIGRRRQELRARLAYERSDLTEAMLRAPNTANFFM